MRYQYSPILGRVRWLPLFLAVLIFGGLPAIDPYGARGANVNRGANLMEAQAVPFSAAAAPIKHRVVGYFPLWIRNQGYSEQDIDFSIVTDVAHFAVTPLTDGRILAPNWGAFPDPDLIAGAHQAAARVVLVVGGDEGAATQGFAGMTASASTRAAFVANLLQVVNDNGYDGVDLDWEFPANAFERDNLTVLVTELRAALGSERTLSLAAPASDTSGNWFDLPSLVGNLDWVGAMTYLLSVPKGSPRADHNAALFPDRSGEESVASITGYYLNRGVPAGKLLIGLPFFGQRFESAKNVHDPIADQAGESIDYRDLRPLIGDGWTAYWDSIAQVPYLLRSSGSGMISYDDST
ncbi:MAG: glycosyl hydrolase family 18 protein, partial [Dehalococcoidia bacterium]